MDYQTILNLAVDLGYELSISGAETFRIEDSMARIAASYGIKAEVFSIPNYLIVSMLTEDGKPITRMRRIGPHGNNLDAVEKLNALSRKICMEHPAPETAMQWLEQVRSAIPYYGLFVSVLGHFLGALGYSLLFGCGATVIYRSKDDGKTWTKQWSFLPTAINDANKGFGASGQGLTLRHGINAGAKKLMFAYFQWNKSGGLSVTAMVSDNDGVNFTRYGNVKPSDNNIDETKAIELSDGSIMFNHRKGVYQGGRAWSKSTDGGKNWTYQGIDGEVLDPGNNADFSRYEFNGRYIKTAKHILMINANVAKANTWFMARKNHTIRMTANDFGNGNGTSTGKYIYTKQLVNGGENLYSGYPSITVLPDGTIATLTEETTVNEQDAYDIVFRRFNLCWLSGGKEYVNYDTDNLFQYKN